MATNIRFMANYGANTVAVKAASDGTLYMTGSSSAPAYMRIQDGTSTNLMEIDSFGNSSAYSLGLYHLAGDYYVRHLEVDNGSTGSTMGRLRINIAAQDLAAIKIAGADGSSVVSAANPLPTTAVITGDVNVDVNSANGTCLIGKTSGGDFTTAYTSATTITIGAIPYSHTFTAEDIISIMQIASDGSVTNTYTRDDKAMSIAGSVITVTGATFSATDKFIIFSCIPRRIYIDQTTPGTTNNVYVTTMKPDGTNTMPSLDTVARAGFLKITDGTDTALVDSSGNLMVSLGTRIAGEDITNDILKVEQRYTPTYQAAAGADVVIKATPGFLHSIIIGKDVLGGIIEVSDHASDGDANVKVYLDSPNVGTYIIDAEFSVGICADLTNQTNVTFVWR